MFKMKKHIRNLLLTSVGLSLFSAVPVKAQQQSQLEDLQEIVALVNDDVISLYDLQQRAMLLMLSRGGRELTPQQQQLIQSQAMSALIDDHLKLQEAEEYDALMTPEQLEESYQNYARQFNLSGDELEEQLERAGIQKDALLTQINGSIAWQGVVNGLLQPQVNITDDEVYNAIETMEQNRGKDEYRVSEIFLLVTDNARLQENVATANAIKEQLQNGAPFNAVAQQFSQSSTAAVGGDMGWVMEAELPNEVKGQILTMNKGEVSDPVITEDGIYILQVTDKRKILTVTEDDTRLNLNSLFFEQAEQSLDFERATMSKLTEYYGNENICTTLPETAASLGNAVVEPLGEINVGELNEEAKGEISSLEVNYGSTLKWEENGYRAFILCGKTVPQVTIPDFDTMLDNMTRTRLQLFARRHLRDLRRDAIIDYR